MKLNKKFQTWGCQNLNFVLLLKIFQIRWKARFYFVTMAIPLALRNHTMTVFLPHRPYFETYNKAFLGVFHRPYFKDGEVTGWIKTDFPLYFCKKMAPKYLSTPIKKHFFREESYVLYIVFERTWSTDAQILILIVFDVIFFIRVCWILICRYLKNNVTHYRYFLSLCYYFLSLY